MLRVFRGEPVHQVDLGADRERGGLGGRGDGLADEVGGPGGVGGVHHLHGALRVHDHLHAGELGAGLLDLADVEALVDRAEAVPEDHPGVEQGLFVVAAEGLARVPHRHLLQRHAHGLGGVAAQVLVGEEQHALAALERPLQHGRGVRGRADDAAVLAAEALERGGGVHVGDRDDRDPAVGVGLGAEDAPRAVPSTRSTESMSAMSAIEQPAARLGRITAWSGPGQDVRGLGHEVHAAEDDGLRVRPGQGRVGELEGVAHEVGVLDHLVALVEVPQDDGAVPQCRFGGADPGVELGVAGQLVLLRELALPRGRGRCDVGGGGARAVGGHAGEGLGEVVVPGPAGQRGAAGGGGRAAVPWWSACSRVISWIAVLTLLMVCSCCLGQGLGGR